MTDLMLLFITNEFWFRIVRFFFGSSLILGLGAPLERPDNVGDRRVYSAAEAQELEGRLQERDAMRHQALDADRPAPEAGAVIGIEAEFDYVVSNTELVPVDGEYRTSLIVDPPDGKLPLRDPYEDYYTRLFDSGVARYDRAEAMGSAEHCLVYALAVPSLFPMPWNAHLSAAVIETLAGDWSGEVNSFNLHFRFLPGKNGGLHAFLDYPAGGMVGMALTYIEYYADSISFAVPAIAAKFSGTLTGRRIDGEWTRAGAVDSLHLNPD